LRTQPPGATMSSAGESGKAPAPSELGFDVTIAMAAITEPDGYIVTVSDRMISYDDIRPHDAHQDPIQQNRFS
jgi:hypothetical protein